MVNRSAYATFLFSTSSRNFFVLYIDAHERDDSEGKVRAQCMWCDNCQVILCIKYFHLLHAVKNPKQLKADVVRQTKIKTIFKTVKTNIHNAKPAPNDKRKNTAVIRRTHEKGNTCLKY